MERVTVFTPTFNRAKVLHRVYDSLTSQTYTDFKWLIVDDGSTDDTRSVVAGFAAEAKFPVEYVYQSNQGKHMATNRAVAMTDTELFVIADSDDAFVPEALEKLVEAWDSIPEEERDNYKGVICRCYDSQSGEPIGTFPGKQFDSNDVDAYFKLNLNFEKWMLLRTDVLREFPFPGENLGLKFFPETVVWQRMGRKYKTRYVDDPLREYFRDQDNALTHAKTPRFRENVFLWAHYVNDTMDHFWDKPMVFVKAFIGMSRDNVLLGKSFKQITAIPNRGWKKAICAVLYPVGWLLSRKFVGSI
jgi:glycosyltransferase involved in cell wall biosynthesis